MERNTRPATNNIKSKVQMTSKIQHNKTGPATDSIDNTVQARSGKNTGPAKTEYMI
jgi:hypothetical protein